TGQISISIDNYLKEVDRSALLAFYDEKLMSIMNRHKDKRNTPLYVSIEESIYISYFLSSLVYDRPEVKDFIVFSNDGIVFGSSGSSVYRGIDLDKEWMQYEYDKSYKVFLKSPHIDKYFKRNIFSVLRPINSLYENELIGMVKINMDLGTFNKIISSSDISENTMIIITDQEGDTYYPDDSKKDLLLGSDQDYIEIDGQEFVYS